MTEDLLIRHAAPTLAGLKTANLVNCRCDSVNKLLSALSSLNRRLGSKGVRVMPLRVWDGRALVYIYRPQKLQQTSKEITRAGCLRAEATAAAHRAAA